MVSHRKKRQPSRKSTSRRSPKSAAPFVPSRATLRSARAAAASCQGCDLWRRATQTVFGAGPAKAAVMLVGEQPGHEEDLAGLPFVGPAGRLLHRALETAGIPLGDVYLTNVVKHFKWEPRGKRRIHSRPRASEVAACRPWLETELALVRPRAVVCLGATAAKALLGSGFSVTAEHGVFVESPLASLVMATVHPASILRAPTHEARDHAMEQLIKDLKALAARLVDVRKSTSARIP
jgi:uracil-DNA glycosylase family protein